MPRPDKQDVTAKPTPESIAAELAVPERVLLFCLASDTDWQKAGVTHATAQHMMVRGLIERQAASRYALLGRSEQKRARVSGAKSREKTSQRETTEQ